ncbi:hypothetical protein D9613_010213 [Agrocybe pediades]|uniref:Uncharacterized protein n=1 Tax=Agrocybe pediades TaxID=84607 RepID=A0A8H4VI22_9AGAR|nr:hypothetical protein D9613_010213 [Agrocybe pediades]
MDILFTRIAARSTSNTRRRRGKNRARRREPEERKSKAGTGEKKSSTPPTPQSHADFTLFHPDSVQQLFLPRTAYRVPVQSSQLQQQYLSWEGGMLEAEDGNEDELEQDGNSLVEGDLLINWRCCLRPVSNGNNVGRKSYPKSGSGPEPEPVTPAGLPQLQHDGPGR